MRTKGDDPASDAERQRRLLELRRRQTDRLRELGVVREPALPVLVPDNPDSFLAVDYMLDRFAWLMEGLVVRAERMRTNLEAGHGLYASQRLLLALVESGLARDDAYRRVQRHAMRAWDEELDFEALVRADDELAGRVELDSVFALEAYTAHVDTVFERLRALRATHAAVVRA